jgi:hypothetical protein
VGEKSNGAALHIGSIGKARTEEAKLRRFALLLCCCWLFHHCEENNTPPEHSGSSSKRP